MNNRTIRMIIMTESSKYGANCVAGINVENGKWVRLVSDNEETHGAIDTKSLTDRNGHQAKVLDLVTVSVLEDCGTPLQPENVKMDTSKYISVERSATFSEVLNIHPAEEKENIYGNTLCYFWANQFMNFGYSLTLVHVKNLKIYRQENGSGQKKLKADFEYNGDYYEEMSVTDPEYYDKSERIYAEAYLVISIGAAYNNKHYKFIAGIYVKPRDWKKIEEQIEDELPFGY